MNCVGSQIGKMQQGRKRPAAEVAYRNDASADWPGQSLERRFEDPARSLYADHPGVRRGRYSSARRRAGHNNFLNGRPGRRIINPDSRDKQRARWHPTFPGREGSAMGVIYASHRFVNTYVLTFCRDPDYPSRMSTATKSGQIQIRVSPAQKAAICRAARRAGLDMSAYVLARLLPAPARRFQDLTQACTDSGNVRFALADLNSWLASLGAGELQQAVSSAPPQLTPYLANYVAAMTEYACVKNGVAPPSWPRATAPLTEPVFGSALMSLRLYLLAHSPAPFRRRNIFIDASVGSRV